MPVSAVRDTFLHLNLISTTSKVGSYEENNIS